MTCFFVIPCFKKFTVIADVETGPWHSKVKTPDLYEDTELAKRRNRSRESVFTEGLYFSEE